MSKSWSSPRETNLSSPRLRHPLPFGVVSIALSPRLVAKRCEQTIQQQRLAVKLHHPALRGAWGGQKLGVSSEQVYWTAGPYDIAAIGRIRQL